MWLSRKTVRRSGEAVRLSHEAVRLSRGVVGLSPEAGGLSGEAVGLSGETVRLSREAAAALCRWCEPPDVATQKKAKPRRGDSGDWLSPPSGLCSCGRLSVGYRLWSVQSNVTEA